MKVCAKGSSSKRFEEKIKSQERPRTKKHCSLKPRWKASVEFLQSVAVFWCKAFEHAPFP